MTSEARNGDNLHCLVRQLISPVALLAVGTACGMVPGEADGVTLAGVPNIVFILFNVCLVSYAAGMIHGILKANAENQALTRERK